MNRDNFAASLGTIALLLAFLIAAAGDTSPAGIAVMLLAACLASLASFVLK